MAKHLDTPQRHNLAVGNALAAEIAATGPGRRAAFVVVQPYHVGPQLQVDVEAPTFVTRGTFSKILNAGRENEGEDATAAL